MPEPSLGDVHVDTALTDYSRAYFQQEGNYIARRVFGTQPTARKSDGYYVYDKEATLRVDAQKRAPNTEAPVRTYTLSTDNFNCDVYSIAVDVSEQIRANADPVLDPEEDAARQTVQDLLGLMDREWNTVAFATGVWGTDSTGSTGTWNGTGDPIQDIAAGKIAMLQQTGFEPNTLVIGASAWFDGLMNHADIVARLPDNSPRIVTTAFLSNLFDIDRVFVAKSIRNTGLEGSTAGSTMAFNLTGDQALLAFVDPSPGPRTATAGRTFLWTGLTGAGEGIRTLRLDMPWKDAMPRVQSDVAFDFKIVGTDLGYFLHNLIT